MPRTKYFLGLLESTEEGNLSYPTLEQFLTSNLPAGQESDELAKKMMERLELDVLDRMKTGVQLEHGLTRSTPISCDSTGLDFALDGGLKRGQVTEIYGNSSSGKTQLCHFLAARNVRFGFRVIYIDTTNGFCAHRIFEFLQPAPAQARQLLNSISVFRTHDAHGLFRLVDRISVEMSELEDQESKPQLIIIDSISGVLSPVMNVGSSQSAALIQCLGRSLRSLADREKIAVFLTNHEISSSQAPSRQTGVSGKSALGIYWNNQVHCRIRIEDYETELKLVRNGGRHAKIRISKDTIETVSCNDRTTL